MSLDVNKILMETLESSEAEANFGQVDNEGNPITENTDYDQNEVVNEETDSEGLPVGIYASAISAGLGAISLRNRLRSVYEMSDEAKRKLKKAGKIGAGAAALGGAGYLAYKQLTGQGDGGPTKPEIEAGTGQHAASQHPGGAGGSGGSGGGKPLTKPGGGAGAPSIKSGGGLTKPGGGAGAPSIKYKQYVT